MGSTNSVYASARRLALPEDEPDVWLHRAPDIRLRAVGRERPLGAAPLAACRELVTRCGQPPAVRFAGRGGRATVAVRRLHGLAPSLLPPPTDWPQSCPCRRRRPGTCPAPRGGRSSAWSAALPLAR